MENFDPLVTTDWLAAHLEDPGLRIVDIRGYVNKTNLGGGRQIAEYVGARDEYDEAHVPGAVYVDWTLDITDPDDPVSVQVAPPERFAQAMGSRGIGDETHVVVYDHTGGQFATRLWWDQVDRRGACHDIRGPRAGARHLHPEAASGVAQRG